MAKDQQAIDRYGVIGNPVSHSRSPAIHRQFADQTGQRMNYELLEVPPDKFESTVSEFRGAGGKGLNVTVPFKLAAARLADRVSERAGEAGAVNTLVLKDDEVFGDNTDGIGLVRDLAANHEFEIDAVTILILGAGGATRGIVGPLLDLGPARIVIANRTVSRASAIADHYARKGRIESCSFDSIPDDSDWQLIINATSAGFKGEALPFPDSAIDGNSFCYDLSYGLEPTPFCEWAKACGAAKQTMGWGMLVEQAAESFHLWRGIRPETAPVLARIVAGVQSGNSAPNA
jgi:shikimate dehydrogenase